MTTLELLGRVAAQTAVRATSIAQATVHPLPLNGGAGSLPEPSGHSAGQIEDAFPFGFDDAQRVDLIIKSLFLPP